MRLTEEVTTPLECPNEKLGDNMRHLITAGFFAVALVAYYLGFEYGSGILFLAGVAFELVSFKRIRDSSAS